MGSRVKVAVRVRPFSARELEFNRECVVWMREDQTIVKGAFTKDGEDKCFAFDHSIWSHEPGQPGHTGQSDVFTALGEEVLGNAFRGYNACIFAYGQTGSGKTHTMMGVPGDDGLIPRLCRRLFEKAGQAREGTVYSVEVSYMEIYQEKVRDLLATRQSAAPLRVREHRALGPYVEGLTRLVVTTFDEVDLLMRRGAALRKTAKTAMNDTSSRSHAVFTLHLSEQRYDPATKHTGEKVSRVSLVDLAGSERAVKTGATGERLKEGALINKSLSTLGLVIKALAAAGDGSSAETFVPYRDSVLTWLLKDSLGGNSKTVMVATISPSVDNLDETISTLRYANSAKQIVNRAVVNEDPNAKMIRELKEELEFLRSQAGGTSTNPASGEELRRIQEQVAETERLIRETAASWEDRVKASQLVMEEHRKLLESNSAHIAEEKGALRLDSELPHLVALDGDGAVVLYPLQPGIVRVGQHGQDPEQHIAFDEGHGIEPEHCLLEHTPATDQGIGVATVMLHPIAECYINESDEIEDSVALQHGDVLRCGPTWTTRFNNPAEALQLRQRGGSSTATLAARERAARAAQEQLAQRQQAIELERERMKASIDARLSQAEQAAQQTRLEADRVRVAIEGQEHTSRELRRTTDEQAVLQHKLEQLEAEIAREKALKDALAKSSASVSLKVQTTAELPESVADSNLEEIAREHQREHELELQRMADRQKREAAEAERWWREENAELERLKQEREAAQREKAEMEAIKRRAREELAEAALRAEEAARFQSSKRGDLHAALASGAEVPTEEQQQRTSATKPPSSRETMGFRSDDFKNNPFLGSVDDFGLGSTASFVADSRSQLAQSQAKRNARVTAVLEETRTSSLSQSSADVIPRTLPAQSESIPRCISPEKMPLIRADDYCSPTSLPDNDWEEELRRLQLDEQLTSDEILARTLQMQDEEAARRAAEMRKQQLLADARVAQAVADDLERERERERREALIRDAELAQQLQVSGNVT